jgi:soluble lytic murein transglycosylase
MSSMHRAASLVLLVALGAMSAPARCQDGSEWDRARAQLMAGQQGTMAQAIQRWQVLSRNDSLSFSEYAGFLLTYPGFPEEARIRASAERALTRESVDYPRLLAYFDRIKPTGNPAKALYALALASAGRSEARALAIEAWRGGAMSETAAAALQSQFGREFTSADHDARMDALLWSGDILQAQQALNFVSPGSRNLFAARLAMAQGNSPEQLGIQPTAEMLRDPGYVFNRIRQLKASGNFPAVSQLLVTRPPATRPPLDPPRAAPGRKRRSESRCRPTMPFPPGPTLAGRASASATTTPH